MKKSIIRITVVLCILLALCTACQSGTPDAPSGTPASQGKPVSGEADTASGSAAESLPEYTAGSIKLEPQDQDDYAFNRKYRIAYYQIGGEFTGLLSEEEYQDYMEWVDEKSKQDGYGENQNEMLLVSFVKRYNISRTDFDKAVKAYTDARNKTGEDLYSEGNEVPNGDIIYTFDNEVINRYYRYE